MNNIFHVERVLPDKSTQRLATVTSMSDTQHITETPQYAGTWINKNRKLLRYGRGEVRIVEEVVGMSVTDSYTVVEDNEPAFRLDIANGDDIDYLIVTTSCIMGYASSDPSPVWVCDSFHNLLHFISKDMAYECLQKYEELTTTYNIQGEL